MPITLNPDQESRILQRVASGDFASVEEAARHLIDEALAERALDEDDDMAWAKPHVDEALAEVERGGRTVPRRAQGPKCGEARGIEALMARVVVTPAADADLEQIIEHLDAHAGYRVAGPYSASFERLHDDLAEFPDSGSPRPRLGRNIRIGVVFS